MSNKNKRLKAGNVVSIRVNPADCMSVVDVVKQAGVYYPGMSFAAMCSLAFTSILQTLRDSEVIPTRDGWEFNELVGPYLGRQNGRKLEVTQTIKSIGSELKVSGLSTPRPAEPIQEAPPKEYVEPELTPEQKRAWTRIRELNAKKELAEQPGSGIVWQNSDQQEYDHLASLV